MIIYKANRDPKLLEDLKILPVPTMTRSQYLRKQHQIASDQNLKSFVNKMVKKYSSEPHWCGALAMIVRNKRNDRGIMTTVLPNSDALAALAAIRLGINMHLAVALALENKLTVHGLDDGILNSTSLKPDDAVVLATLYEAHATDPFLGVLAHKKSRSYKLKFRPEELILLEVHGERGFYMPFRTAHYSDRLERNLTCRFDETVWFGVAGKDEYPLAA